MAAKNKKELSPAQREDLLNTLKARFEKNRNLHKGIEWAAVQAKLEGNQEKLWSLNEMEITGGEPDVVSYDKKQTSTLSMTVQRRVRKAAEVFVTTGKHWRQEKNLNQPTTPLIWLLKWALKF
jgi:hypothetical protein